VAPPTPVSRSRANSVREGRDQVREEQRLQAASSSILLPPISRSASISSSVSVTSTVVTSQTERDPKDSLPQTRPPTRERNRDRERHLESSTPISSTPPLPTISSVPYSQSQLHPRERSQVLSDVYMLDLGAFSYIPLVTAYAIEIMTEGPNAYVVTDPVVPGRIMMPLPEEKGADMRVESSGLGLGLGWRSDSGRYANYSYSQGPGLR
jgi:hypothetical protein